MGDQKWYLSAGAIAFGLTMLNIIIIIFVCWCILWLMVVTSGKVEVGGDSVADIADLESQAPEADVAWKGLARWSALPSRPMSLHRHCELALELPVTAIE